MQLPVPPEQAQQTSQSCRSLFSPCTFLFSVSSQQNCFQGWSHFSGQSSQAKISAEFRYWCRSALLGGESSLSSGSCSLSNQGNPSLEPRKPNPVTSADIYHHLRAGQGSLDFKQGWNWVGAGRNSLVSSRAGTESGSYKEKLNAAFSRGGTKLGPW